VTSFYLLDNRNPNGSHFYATRARPVLAQVIHITAGLEDLDALDDHSAEKTARYAATTDRSVSWHSGSDSDSEFELLPVTYTAFQVRGYNSATVGHEISKAITNWRAVSAKWRDRTLVQAARNQARKAVQLGNPIRLATKAELDAAIRHYDRTGEARPVGFVGHGVLDPGRRTDPGTIARTGEDTFPWEEFLRLVRLYAGQTPTTPDTTEDDVMFVELIRMAYRRARGKDYDASVGDPNGWTGWMIRLAFADSPDERRAVVGLMSRAIDREIAAKK